MRHIKHKSGFTLIELIVVIAIMSIMLVVVVPRFPPSFFTDSTREALSWIILNVRTLKERARDDQIKYVLHINVDTNRFWISTESMEEEALLQAEQNGYALSGDDNILDVEFSETGAVTYGTADICFYPKGYSDKAVIHIEDSGNNRKSVLIEPFLLNVKMVDEYVSIAG